MTLNEKDRLYLDILLESLEVCKNYRPKLGRGGKKGYSLQEFREIYGDDTFYSWMGLDSPLMYAAHKAAGGMTSIYRQIGSGCEKIFRVALRDNLNLNDEDTKWSYTVPGTGGRTRTLHLDGRIPLAKLDDKNRHSVVLNWIHRSSEILEIDSNIRNSLKGIVFEIRQGYKSKDSKRQNADIANAAAAYTKGYLPCAAILSQQIDQDISMRYTAEKWMLLKGITNNSTPHESFYTFMRDIVGYDIAAFFERNKDVIKKQVTNILESLLSTK
ncbi:MAG: hypothetical protein KAW12_11055 [Candidatus Aminicenantes bacterium]|nr:hypothetical protein [Candidatus Aminicenantes bacterium]